ncbi:hypothetical protein FRC06_002863 [Ceratobasidium sp. 370]|nr:hypothetical protein FRC06_002863 [Ceratobasidium sp. 370]
MEPPMWTLTWFVTKVLRQSRTSINVLQVALAYLAGAKPEIHNQLRIAANRQAELAIQIAGIPQHVRDTLPGMDWLSSEFTPLPLIDLRRTFLASLVLASKFLLDKAFSNKAWAKRASPLGLWTNPHTPGDMLLSLWTVEAIDTSDSDNGRLLSTKFPCTVLSSHGMSSQTSLVSGAWPERVLKNAPLNLPSSILQILGTNLSIPRLRPMSLVADVLLFDIFLPQHHASQVARLFASAPLTLDRSIQHLMNHSANAPALGTPPLPSHHSSPLVAHSLLRGTQEGWATLKDSSTAEALQKLDGLSGNKEQLGLMMQEADPPPDAENKTPGRKTLSRDGPLASSTMFTGMPTTSSRDSASLSTTVSATSTSLSSWKLQRNSRGSNASSSYVVAEAGGLVGEEGTAAEIPPVPLLPKGLSAYKTLPMSAGVTFPGSGLHMGMGGGESGFESMSEVAGSDDPDRTVVFPSMSMTIMSLTSPPPPVPMHQPSKKWSFSNALNLRLPSGSPKDLLHVQKELPNTPQKDPHGYVSLPQKTPRSQGSVSFSAFPVNTSSPTGSGGGSSENWSAVEHSEVVILRHRVCQQPVAWAWPEHPRLVTITTPRTPETVMQSFPRTPETTTQHFPKTPEGPSHV